MKYIDKFLKKLHTDRNTFATYILTLVTLYLAVDRIVEMLLMIFTGVSYSYWGPIRYALALACPVFAFAFSGPSKFVKNKSQKVTVFFVFATALYIIAISMFTQWLNMGVWLLLLSVPNYAEIITDFSNLVTPAFVSISLYLPLVTFYPFFKFLYFSVYDSKDRTRSIWDYGGIDLSNKKEGHGPYTCEVYVCTDDEKGTKIVMPESSRYQSLFVCGGSGSGKTSLVFEPFMAKDIERKYFFKEVSKELGYTALKTNIAYLKKPYNNEFLNKNFNLNMITPVAGKEAVYNAFVKKMILGKSDGETVYRDLGLTLMSPDYEVISHMMDVCKNFGVEYNVVDPNNPTNSIGINPFVYDNPTKIAITISSAIKSMYVVHNHDAEEAYREDLSMQAIENVTMLLKEMYPRMNEGKLPNLEDLLKMFSNFELIEKMCRIMEHDEELKEKYSIQISYFKKNFYKGSAGEENMEKYLYPAISQLDNLLRIPGLKPILCNRHSNINFDDLLADGKFTFVCTRRGDLGSAGHKAFGLFFLMSLQNAVLRRPGNENNRIPHFLYIDEFSDFVCKATDIMFTMFRKYKVGNTISLQTLSQLSPDGQSSSKSLILANCASKIFTGNGDNEELKWWSEEFGNKREWKYTNSMDMNKLEYDAKWGSVKWDWTKYFQVGKLQNLTNTKCAYKIRGANGKPMVGPGNFRYMESKYKEPQKIKTFDFGKYSDSVTTETEDTENGKKKFDLNNINFIDERNEFNPVQTDTTDSKYLFDNEDAIIVNFKKNEKRN